MRWLLTLVLVPLLSQSAAALDYDTIDRKIEKEPAYQSGKPRYGLLLFGPQAGLSIWVVQDGETIYIDRNGDGDLTADDERFANDEACNGLEIADHDGKTRYRIDSLMTDYSLYTAEARKEREEKKIPPSMLVDVSIQGAVNYEQYCEISEMRADSASAQLAHFHGPLTIGPRTINWQLPDDTVLNAGDEPSELFAVVGTMSPKHGCWVVIRSGAGDQSAFPEGVHPVAEITFESADAGDKPVRQRYPLDKFC